MNVHTASRCSVRPWQGEARAPPRCIPPVVAVPPPTPPAFRGKVPMSAEAEKDNRKKKRFSVCWTPDEYAEMTTRAAEAGLSVSAFIRAAALGDAGPRARRRPIVDAAALAQTHAELRRIGNNLNQIAHALNIGETVFFPTVIKAHEELSIVLFEIARALGYRPEG